MKRKTQYVTAGHAKLTNTCPQINGNVFLGCGGEFDNSKEVSEAYDRKISCLNCGFTWYNSSGDHTNLCLRCGLEN